MPRPSTRTEDETEIQQIQQDQSAVLGDSKKNELNVEVVTEHYV